MGLEILVGILTMALTVELTKRDRKPPIQFQVAAKNSLCHKNNHPFSCLTHVVTGTYIVPAPANQEAIDAIVGHSLLNAVYILLETMPNRSMPHFATQPPFTAC